MFALNAISQLLAASFHPLLFPRDRRCTPRIDRRAARCFVRSSRRSVMTPLCRYNATRENCRKYKRTVRAQSTKIERRQNSQWKPSASYATLNRVSLDRKFDTFLGCVISFQTMSKRIFGCGLMELTRRILIRKIQREYDCLLEFTYIK